MQDEKSEDQRLMVYFTYVVRSILKVVGNRKVSLHRKSNIPRFEHRVITFIPGHASQNHQRYWEPRRAGASCQLAASVASAAGIPHTSELGLVASSSAGLSCSKQSSRVAVLARS